MANGRDINELQNILTYKFTSLSLLEEAMTHSSYANEKGVNSYERTEFLGDSVIELIISALLFECFPDFDEGKLTFARKHIVCGKTLSEISSSLNLHEFLRLGHGEEKSMGRDKESIRADIFEAMIGAIYLDCNKDLTIVAKYILPYFNKYIDNCLKSRDGDYKSELLRIVEQDGLETLTFTHFERQNEGNTVFVANAMLNSNVIGTGVGKKVKEAENYAAKHALKLFGFYNE